MQNLTLKQKLNQMFICGYKNANPFVNPLFLELVQNNLGGVIFFSENLTSRKSFKQTVNDLKALNKRLFLSIDQEGGLVERTVMLDEKIEYITPKALNTLKNPDEIKQHYDILCQDLSDLGLNMNFAPVVDVNTNPYNPIIGVRAFSDNPKEVIERAKIVLESFKEHNIFSVAKHFPGHGAAGVDSHLDMPVIEDDFENFYKTHLVCFEETLKNGVNGIMIAHVHYSFFDKENLPASLSKNIVGKYLKNTLKSDALVFSDDMVMGGIAKHFGLFEAVKAGIEAGIEVFLFRDTTQELISALNQIEAYALENSDFKAKIEAAFAKISAVKDNFLQTNDDSKEFDINKNREIIAKITQNTVIINKKGSLLPLVPQKKYLLVAFDTNNVFNLSFNKLSPAECLQEFDVEEIKFSLNPDSAEIEKISDMLHNDSTVIFISYNAHINRGQIKLFEKIKVPKILISTGLDYDIQVLKDADTVITSNCFKYGSIKQIAKILK
ncbi:MAG: glycoside hydrolase family 3 N-terminal domain-containing protein [Candidatus Gastranaerophilales bacterium]|nr:glycoside hydrolase family 3 N-terminal domain-containing protein [Candidatus Gastranaerophilales bacterium]